MQLMISDIHMYILNHLNMISQSTKLKINYFNADMGLNDCPYLNQLRLNNVLLHRSKPFIKNVITKNIVPKPL